MQTAKPLDGIRVIDLGQIFAAPYCTLQLACMGAEIIKVEPPKIGEHLRRPEASPGGVSYSFLMLNANKKSITLNLKHPRSHEVMLKLLADADVLVENYSTGVMESLRLGYEDLRGEFPRLIYASGKGYGSDGPWAKLGAMDSTVQAASGFISVTGSEEGPGARTPATFIDMGAGSHLTSGILAALIQRGRTGRGQKVEVAMLDMCVPSMTGLIANELEGKPYTRMGNRHPQCLPVERLCRGGRRNPDFLPDGGPLANGRRADAPRGLAEVAAVQGSCGALRDCGRSRWYCQRMDARPHSGPSRAHADGARGAMRTRAFGRGGGRRPGN